MKLNKNIISKITLAFGLFAVVFLASASQNPVAALYGSDVILGTTTPTVHVTVDAGLADSLPQIVMATTAFTGMVGTAVLLKKTK